MDDLIHEVGNVVHVADDGLHALSLGGGYKVVVFEELAHLRKEGGVTPHLWVVQSLDKCVRFLLGKGVDELLREFDSCHVVCLLSLLSATFCDATDDVINAGLCHAVAKYLVACRVTPALGIAVGQSLEAFAFCRGETAYDGMG